MPMGVLRAVAVSMALLSAFMVANLPLGQPAVAADSLKVDGLPNDPRQFRTSVEALIGQVDKLVAKLKASPEAQALVLDLIQTRDNVLREIAKLEGTPGDAKWNPKEMRESVEAMLKLMKAQYEKAATMVG
ncbi:hypothetical protein [Candidatus Nitrospira bockiana]